MADRMRLPAACNASMSVMSISARASRTRVEIGASHEGPVGVGGCREPVWRPNPERGQRPPHLAERRILAADRATSVMPTSSNHLIHSIARFLLDRIGYYCHRGGLDPPQVSVDAPYSASAVPSAHSAHRVDPLAVGRSEIADIPAIGKNSAADGASAPHRSRRQRRIRPNHWTSRMADPHVEWDRAGIALALRDDASVFL